VFPWTAGTFTFDNNTVGFIARKIASCYRKIGVHVFRLGRIVGCIAGITQVVTIGTVEYTPGECSLRTRVTSYLMEVTLISRQINFHHIVNP
jgi:hypothetical protein